MDARVLPLPVDQQAASASTLNKMLKCSGGQTLYRRCSAKESTGVLLNRMAPEIVQSAKQRLEAGGLLDM